MRINWFIAAALVLSAPIQAQTADPGTLTYEAMTGNSPAGVSRLRVTKVEADAYAIDFSIVAPNPSQHTGHIQGLATRQGKRLTMKVPIFLEDGKIDHPALCTLVIDIDDFRASVVSADKCAGFGGAATSFVEQGRELQRVP